MDIVQIIFIALAALVLGAGLLTVTARNLVHAALWLIAGFFGVGALYLLMEAEFAAVAQVLVYVGAIAVLVLFAIMLTPDVAGEGEQPIFRARWQALVVAAALFGVLLVPVIFTHTWAVFEQLGAQPLQLAGPRELGIALMREYLLPFELASVLLLAALVGAIVIGLDAGVGRRVLTLAEELRARRAAPPAPEPAPEQSAEQP